MNLAQPKDPKSEDSQHPDLCEGDTSMSDQDIGKLILPKSAPMEVAVESKTPRSVSFQDSGVNMKSDAQTCSSAKDDARTKSTEKESDGLSSQTNQKESSSSNEEDALPRNTFQMNLLDVKMLLSYTEKGKKCMSQGPATCLCKECVENHNNFVGSSKEQSKKDEKKVREESEVLCPDNTSEKSASGSERSRHTNSSEEAEKGNGNECTLPYPDNKKPPEPITRLSNAGLYEQKDNPAGNGNTKEKVEEEEHQCKEVTPSVFVQDQQKNKSLRSISKKGQIEMGEIDIEKGEAEAKPLLRLHRIKSADESVEATPTCCLWERSCVKIVISFFVSLIVFPVLLYVAYAFLPFDTPSMPHITTRLVYTLRCSVFASFPIILGVIIHGISRLCSLSFDPFTSKVREVTIHRRFVKQSTLLFVLYFFNLAVLSTYVPQQYLKLIPLLTCLFTLSQLLYWLSFAVGRSFRSFGYGMTFLPLFAMLVYNMYFMFIIDPEKMVFQGMEDAGKSNAKSG